VVLDKPGYATALVQKEQRLGIFRVWPPFALFQGHHRAFCRGKLLRLGNSHSFHDWCEFRHKRAFFVDLCMAADQLEEGG